jgi:hypothetical protein
VSDEANEAKKDTITIEGKAYETRALGYAEWGELIDWVQDRTIGIIRDKVMAAKLPADVTVAIIRDAFLRLPCIGRYSDETRAAIATAEGGTRLLWLSVRHVLPITLDEFRAKWDAENAA